MNVSPQNKRRVRVGINGFGRIGRVVFRAGFEKLEIVGINDLTDATTLAHLLKFDSTHGRFSAEVTAEDSSLRVNGKRIPLSSQKDPAQIPWQQWEADVVLECTGVFTNKESCMKHLQAGARKVLLSAPAKGKGKDDVDLTVVFGVNHLQYSPLKHDVVSNASCTTNCLAPVAKVLHENFGIEHGFMTTIHSYTLDQRILDAVHKDLRRARSAAVSMIPTTTGAAKAVGLVLPELAGKVDGFAIRVPTINVSLVDFNFQTSKKLSVSAINESLQAAAQGALKGILDFEKLPLVSADFCGHPASSIVDLLSTMVVGDHLGKVVSWYDNEFGFSSRMVDMAIHLGEN